MFESMLEQVAGQTTAPGDVHWIGSMTGVRVCDFIYRPPLGAIPLTLSPGHFETLFCLQGSIHIRWKDGHNINLQEREILLISDLSQIQEIRWTKNFAQGVLVAVDAAKAHESLHQLCTLMGGSPLNISQVKEIMRRQNGCAIISQNAWNDAIFHTINDLTIKQRGQYCTFLAVELLYLLCCGNHILPWKSPSTYFDNHQINAARQVHAYILSHLDESMTIGRLAQMSHISSTLLKSCFRQLYGQPIHKYIQECRMRQAANLLTSTNQPILQIAISVGYESTSQFGALFKRYYRMTPSQYRKKMSEPVNFCPK